MLSLAGLRLNAVLVVARIRLVRERLERVTLALIAKLVARPIGDALGRLLVEVRRRVRVARLLVIAGESPRIDARAAVLEMRDCLFAFELVVIDASASEDENDDRPEDDSASHEAHRTRRVPALSRAVRASERERTKAIAVFRP